MNIGEPGSEKRRAHMKRIGAKGGSLSPTNFKNDPERARMLATKRVPSVCKVCGDVHHAKGFCNRHYLQVKRYGKITRG